MKFKFKFGEFFLGLATLIVIVLSIVLWIFIMTSDQRFSNIGQQIKIISLKSKRVVTILSHYMIYIFQLLHMVLLMEICVSYMIQKII